MNKISKHIIEEDNLNQSYKSIKFGVCKALSEFGLSPENAENFLQKIAFSGIQLDPVDLLKQYSMFLIGGGAAAGLGTAWLRNKMEKTIKSTDTQEMRNTKSKVDAYKKMIRNIQEEKNFTQSESDLSSIGSV